MSTVTIQDLEQRIAKSAVMRGLFSAAASPETIGRYQVLERLGAGGMGVVYRAHDPQLGRDVALKLLRQAPRDDASETPSPLIREARSIARLAHPNVVTVYDVDVDSGQLFVALELIAGQSLREWLEAPRPWRQVAAALAKAGRGLLAAHEAGILHCDVKPANVLLGDDGRVCMADFGLATAVTSLDLASPLDLTQTRIGGTPAYMAPEQYLNATRDARTDQYAFCVTLYEALFGYRPFDAETLPALRQQVLNEPAALPVAARKLPHALCHALERGLSKNRHDRFESMQPLCELLEDLGAGVSVSTRPPPAARPSQATTRLDRYLAGLPKGLDSYPEECSTARLGALLLALKPLDPVPPVLQHAVEAVQHSEMVPVVYARAIHIALYEQHFTSLEAWRQFLGGVLRNFMRVQFVNFHLQPPDSPYFAEALRATFNRFTQGYGFELVSQQPGQAEFVMRHSPHSTEEVVRESLCEGLRLGMELAGCSVAETRVRSASDEAFCVDARWS